ncbi:Arylsulfotransferase (ASST) [Geosmithia morbida]|uniref:Arylsulfotransferase (ASST) n=1 Tax=Geosmithia morbida TaxID=1094350 RepID=A0A9P4YPI3_9HYPO|nr:Arylsulfotransferase (ASST) [Geosmithia morbida]KAF4120345.1 Arylsulfotransferase (ASST) [Geosmithia morbida]
MRLLPLPVAVAATVLDLASASSSSSSSSSNIVSAFNSRHLYDWGWYGWYPTKGFRSFRGTVPRLDFLQWDERCMDGYYLMTPKGRLVDTPGPLVVDGRGNLVWSGALSIGAASDLASQTYRGKRYLTYWKDIEGITMGFGRGEHYMLDENYNVFRTVSAVGEGMMDDLHDFRITRDDTVLLTAYAPRPWDLSSIGGPAQGWIMDSIFQEVDIETGELLFEWRASQHVPLEDTIRYYANRDTGLAPELGFDYFHINSMDKDVRGNYLVSGRHTQTVHCVHPNGTTLWTLGGRGNMFADLSGGRATDFAYQHHIRIDDDDVLSMFDNAKAERSGPAPPHGYSRGLVIRLDQERLTAELLHEVHDPRHPKHADSQGSAQMWDGGRSMVVDFGFIPAFTEFDTNSSEVLCDVRLAPSIMFPFGSVGSYRVTKGHWTGRPVRRPDAVLDPSEARLYVSWNGATEVASWALQGADWAGVGSGPWADLAVEPRDGRFEVSFDLSSSMPEYLRAVALDSDGNVLGQTVRISRDRGNPSLPDVFGVVLSWLGWLSNMGATCVALFAWDHCRPLRSRLARIAVKSWLVLRPALYRLICCCLPSKTRGGASFGSAGGTLPLSIKGSSTSIFLSLWSGGARNGRPHEMRPLYNSDEE